MTSDLVTQLPGGFLLCSPTANGLIARAFDGLSRAEHMPLTGAAQRIRDAAADAVRHAQAGHADVRDEPDPARSCHDDEIGTVEAAELLGCSDRHVRRLAEDGLLGQVRKLHGRILISAAEVRAFQEDRRSA